MTPSARFRQLAHTVVHGLHTVFAGAARRLDVIDQRLVVAAREEPPAPVVNSDDPPAHWLARVQRSGPPAHWLEDIRRRAANPDRIETFDVTLPSPPLEHRRPAGLQDRGETFAVPSPPLNDVTEQPPDVTITEDSVRTTKRSLGSPSPARSTSDPATTVGKSATHEAGTVIRRGVTRPPEGSASTASVKRERVEDEASAPAHHVVAPPPEESATTARLKTERAEIPASSAPHDSPAHPPEASISRRAVADTRLLRRSTTRPAVRAVPTIVGPMARKPVEPEWRPAEPSQPQHQTAPALQATSRRVARGNNQPIVAVRRGRMKTVNEKLPAPHQADTQVGPYVIQPASQPHVADTQPLSGGPVSPPRHVIQPVSPPHVVDTQRRSGGPVWPPHVADTQPRSGGPVLPPHQADTRVGPYVTQPASSPHAPPARPAEPLEPMAPQPNQWPELPASTWADDADSDSETRENDHVRNLAHEQEGSR